MSKVKSYRKKPVVVKAIKFTETNVSEIKEFAGDSVSIAIYDEAWKLGEAFPGVEAIIHTLEGDMKASVGDYIVRGVEGEFYPCKGGIFEKTYEAVDEDPYPCLSCGMDQTFCCGCDKEREWRKRNK